MMRGTVVALAALALVALALGRGERRPAVEAASMGGNTVSAFGRTYRARMLGGEAVLETSFDGGATWAYGTGLGGASLMDPLQVVVSGQVVYVIGRGASGYDYAKGTMYYNDDNGDALAPWQPIGNGATGRVP